MKGCYSVTCESVNRDIMADLVSGSSSNLHHKRLSSLWWKYCWKCRKIFRPFHQKVWRESGKCLKQSYIIRRQLDNFSVSHLFGAKYDEGLMIVIPGNVDLDESEEAFWGVCPTNERVRQAKPTWICQLCQFLWFQCISNVRFTYAVLEVYLVCDKLFADFLHSWDLQQSGDLSNHHLILLKLRRCRHFNRGNIRGG